MVVLGCVVALAFGCTSVEKTNSMSLKDAYPDTAYWRPPETWYGFNLLGMFCKDRLKDGDKRIHGYFPEDHFQWIEEWGFNFARLPLDYRFFVEEGDWMKLKESSLQKLDEAVRYGKKHGIHVQINIHRAPGYCCNPPKDPQSLYFDKEPLAAFTNLWGTLARRYKGIPNEELSFDLVNEPGPEGGATTTNYATVVHAAFAAIRSVDRDRFIMSDGWNWGNKPTMELHPFDGASGESIHCYTPSMITHSHKFKHRKDLKENLVWPPKGATNGVEWLEQNYIKKYQWQEAIDDGTFLFFGEFGCYQHTLPHAVYLAWLEDALKLCEKHGWGWALWNIDGPFGIMDTRSVDCEFEDFRGHKLDRKALDLLIKYAKRNKMVK